MGSFRAIGKEGDVKYTCQGNEPALRAGRLAGAVAVLVLASGTAACAQVAALSHPAAPQTPAAPVPSPQNQAAAPETIEMVRSCAVENGLWVCRYQPPASVIAFNPGTVTPVPPPAVAPPPAAAGDPERVEQARLMVRCGTATWLSLCTPAQRREARRLKDISERREGLRREVTRLLSQNQCEAAARTALEGADMALALEVRTYCERPAAR